MLYSVWLRNRLISAGSKTDLRCTYKTCITSSYRQLSAYGKIKNDNNTSFISPGLRFLGTNNQNQSYSTKVPKVFDPINNKTRL